jgi:hypothetical protein
MSNARVLPVDRNATLYDFDPGSTIQQALADKNSKLLKVIALASATKRQFPL